MRCPASRASGQREYPTFFESLARFESVCSLLPHRAVTRCRKLFPSNGCRPAVLLVPWCRSTRGNVPGRTLMRNFLLTTCLGAVAALAAGAVHANDELIK